MFAAIAREGLAQSSPVQVYPIDALFNMAIQPRKHYGIMGKGRAIGKVLKGSFTTPGALLVTLNNVSLCVNLDQCNLRCLMCWQTYTREANRQLYQTTNMSQENLLDILQNHWLKNTTISVVGGGEPFLYPHINDLLSKAPNECRRLMIMTNGTLLHKNRFLWEVAATAPLTLMFSIDAATSSTYANIRRDGSWSILMQNIERYVALLAKNPRLKISTSFVVIKKNLHELVDFLRLNVLWRSEYVHIHPAIQGGFPDELQVDVNSQEYRQVIREAIDFARRHGIAIDRLSELIPQSPHSPDKLLEADRLEPGKIRADDPRHGCRMHSESMTVSHIGDIYLCDTAFRVPYRCGNLFTQGLLRAWLSPEWLSVRLAHHQGTQHLHPLCSRCLLVAG